jgi:hypothetical protein
MVIALHQCSNRSRIGSTLGKRRSSETSEAG